jgi:hypothetical protein
MDGRTRRREDTRQKLYETADLDVRLACSALFGVGLVAAVDWLVFTPERPVEEVEEALRAIVRRVAVG